MERIVLATRNPGKFSELSKMLNVFGVEFVPIPPEIPELEETGDTFVVNALDKARYASMQTGMPAIADDSGLEIRALGDWPGVRSARCAGENATEIETVACVLDRMRGVADRSARFVCVMALHFSPGENNGLIAWFTGTCEGKLLEEPRGEAKSGLQYDTIFQAHCDSASFAEMHHHVKNSISHRGQAARQMREFLVRL